jgi:predicted ArsR family transcriptional regulator
MSDDSTRHKILDRLKKERVSTANEIAQDLQLTGAAARYHLSKLKKEGLVEVTYQSSQKHPGRPTQSFYLSATSQPNNLAKLSCALLEYFVAAVESEKTDLTWKDLAVRVIDVVPVGGIYPRRLTETIGILNRMNYQARWEAGPHGPRILFSNCPYAVILNQFPGLCRMDRFILERMTGREELQISRMVASDPKHKYCIFEEA